MNLKRYGKLFPEKAVPVFGLRLAVYLDENGAECLDWRLDGRISLGTALGTLELVKAQMIAEVEESSDA